MFSFTSPGSKRFFSGAILSPTDPVFAAAIIGRKEIPGRLKRLLNVESGVNDGLALPLVLICLSVIGHYEAGYVGLATELLVLAVSSLVHANIYLAAFSAGVTIASTRRALRDEFHRFGELLTELLKLGTLLVFGALMSPHLFGELHALDYLFATLALLFARPAAMLIPARCSQRRPPLPPHRARHRRLDHRPFLDRCSPGPLVRGCEKGKSTRTGSASRLIVRA
ncbi:MAG: cation:proton antiporter [Verrucomicrobiota bacterium]|nr:cation:proton antiporter [Verrucomicrobiota bacterium]